YRELPGISLSAATGLSTGFRGACSCQGLGTRGRHVHRSDPGRYLLLEVGRTIRQGPRRPAGCGACGHETRLRRARTRVGATGIRERTAVDRGYRTVSAPGERQGDGGGILGGAVSEPGALAQGDARTADLQCRPA